MVNEFRIENVRWSTIQQEGFTLRERKIITPKDTMYLSDLLALSKLNAKKAHLYHQDCTDEDVKKKIKDIECIFVDGYDELLEMLED